MTVIGTLAHAIQPLGTHEYILFALGICLLASYPIPYYLCLFAYNIYFHPLSKYPGPRIASATSWWLALPYVRGGLHKYLLKLHEQYGPVVRTSPNELSFINPAQWKEIYGHKPPGHLEFSKDEKYHSGIKGGPLILNADRHYHQYIRKLLIHGFSEKALREQEPVMQRYISVLFQKLQEISRNGTAPIDILSWYDFMTFDLVGFLTFGESFDCLTNSRLHKWIEVFFSFAKLLAFSQAIARLPFLVQTPLKLWAIPTSVKSDISTLQQLNTEKIKHRLEHESDVPDFMDKLIEAYKAGKMSFQQLTGNASTLISAGSETTATLLSGLTYLLLKNPRVLQILTNEVRGAFSHPDEITIARVNKCRYLLACIEEALRIYPPSPQPHHRIIPPGGAMVNGEYLPEGVSVAIPIYAASRSPYNWSQPDSFIPERWLGEDPQFSNDKRDASQPFSFGPRNCIGRNLAYVEMKIIVARLMWHFDIENATEGDWLDQKVYLIWEKAPLWVKLHPVQRS
ncbi:cytochrome P450 [Hypoxylon trugodes]|uniref:cytochrome P450 n=1 Tax=Hypoxylon trugodes TaxID=326681 RepID=UPI002198A8DF|nr:cytochrome P450 [Hypoxylon trugodes]KAI1391262.1 cytochrome P450 [Hypoxylon trugodes]